MSNSTQQELTPDGGFHYNGHMWRVGACGLRLDPPRVRFVAFRELIQATRSGPRDVAEPPTAIYYFLALNDGSGNPAEGEQILHHHRPLPNDFQTPWPPVPGSAASFSTETSSGSNVDSDYGEGPSNGAAGPSNYQNYGNFKFKPSHHDGFAGQWHDPKSNPLSKYYQGAGGSNPQPSPPLPSAIASSLPVLPENTGQTSSSSHASAAGSSTDPNSSSSGLYMTTLAAMGDSSLDDTTSRAHSATSATDQGPRHDYGSTVSGNSTATATVIPSTTTGSSSAGPSRLVVPHPQDQSGSHISSGYAPDRDSSSPSFSDVTLHSTSCGTSSASSSGGSAVSSYVGSSLGGLNPDEVLGGQPIERRNETRNASHPDYGGILGSGATTPTAVRYPSGSLAVPLTGLSDLGSSSSGSSVSRANQPPVGQTQVPAAPTSGSSASSTSSSTSSDSSTSSSDRRATIGSSRRQASSDPVSFESSSLASSSTTTSSSAETRSDATSPYGVVSGSGSSESFLPATQQAHWQYLATHPNINIPLLVREPAAPVLRRMSGRISVQQNATLHNIDNKEDQEDATELESDDSSTSDAETVLSQPESVIGSQVVARPLRKKKATSQLVMNADN